MMNAQVIPPCARCGSKLRLTGGGPEFAPMIPAVPDSSANEPVKAEQQMQPEKRWWVECENAYCEWGGSVTFAEIRWVTPA